VSHDEGRTCPCVSDHRPKVAELQEHHLHPVYLGGAKDGETVFICPSTHVSAHELIRLYLKLDGPPPAGVMNDYARYARVLAAEAWSRYTASRSA
jgi:hypothetical protein